MSRQRTIRTFTIGGVAAFGAISVLGVAGPASAETEVPEPSSFTSAFTVMATPETVINNDGVATPGTAGATGEFTYRINSDQEIICYDLSVTGLSGDYQSPAKTATHIHEAVAGQAGPPRVAFPNPGPIEDGTRTSSGCLQGPFTTGVVTDGVDSGEGFTLGEIEANPAGFFGDTHTVANPAGAVRGQLTQVPVGGVQTGGGATAASETAASDTLAPIGAIGIGAAALIAVTGLVAYRRRSTASGN